MDEVNQIKEERKSIPRPAYQDRVVNLRWVRIAVYVLLAIHIYEIAEPYVRPLLETL